MAKPRVREYSGKVIFNPFYQRRRVSSLQSKKPMQTSLPHVRIGSFYCVSLKGKDSAS